jgi:hypothetical protein
MMPPIYTYTLIGNINPYIYTPTIYYHSTGYYIRSFPKGTRLKWQPRQGINKLQA